jgi:hypothetical protein
MVDTNSVSYRLRFEDESPLVDSSTCTLSIVAEEGKEDEGLFFVCINETQFFAILLKLASPLSLLAPHKGGKYYVKWFIAHELVLFCTKERRREYTASLKQCFIPFSDHCLLSVKDGKLDHWLSKDDFYETVEEVSSGKVEIYNRILTVPLSLFDLSSGRKSLVSSEVVNSLRKITIDIQDGESLEKSFEKSGLSDLYRRLCLGETMNLF